MRVMLNDFPGQYRKNYPSREKAILLKERLMKKLDGARPQSIIDGYELCIDSDPDFMPGISKIRESVFEIEKATKRRERESQAIESKKLEPPPTMTVEPLKLLSEAKEDKPEITFQDRVKAHEALIKTFDAQGKIRRTPYHMSSGCASFGCKNPGTVSSSLRGTDTWYCMTCYRKSS